MLAYILKWYTARYLVQFFFWQNAREITINIKIMCFITYYCKQ